MVEPKASTSSRFSDADFARVVAAAASAAAKLALHATGRAQLARGEMDRLAAQLKSLLEVIDALP